MWELIVGIGNLAWAMISSAFLLYKQLTGIQNDILAVLLGVSPVLLSVLMFVIKLIFKGLKELRY